MSEVPIYRAKKIDSDEYVEGFYIPYNDKECYIGHRDIVCISNRLVSEDKLDVRAIKCDITTLSIHFPDMLDCNKKPIFASLQDDGRGGDIIEYKGRQYTFGYKKEYFKVGLLKFRGWQLTTSDLLKVKIIGIQE